MASVQRGDRYRPSPRPPLIPFVVAPRRIDHLSLRNAPATRSEVARIWWASVVPLRKPRVGISSSAQTASGSPGQWSPRPGGRPSPPLQCVDELPGVEVEEPLRFPGFAR